MNAPTVHAPIVSNYLSTRNEVHYSPQRQIIAPVSSLPIQIAQPQINQVYLPSQTTVNDYGNLIQPSALIS